MQWQAFCPAVWLACWRKFQRKLSLTSEFSAAILKERRMIVGYVIFLLPACGWFNQVTKICSIWEKPTRLWFWATTRKCNNNAKHFGNFSLKWIANKSCCHDNIDSRFYHWKIIHFFQWKFPTVMMMISTRMSRYELKPGPADDVNIIKSIYKF